MRIPEIVNVKEYGAAGNGMTDDYYAIQSAIQAINHRGGGIMFFPPGVYKINQYKILDKTITGLLPNGITNFTYNKCNGLKIMGYNAKIDLKGDFKQTADLYLYTDSSGVKRYESYSETVVPFYMQECTNFSIGGFEIDGNVDQMTCDPGVVETHSYGIVASTCKDYNISNVYVHHMATDGVVLGYAQPPAPSTEKILADRNSYLYNVRSSNNARQGCTIDQLRGGTFVECIFENTGAQTNGITAYPNHSPGLGLDIEPDSNISTQPPVDVNTGELNFIRCSFHSNFGGQVSCCCPGSTDNVFFHDCSIKTENPPNPLGDSRDSGFQQIQIITENGVMENCYIDLGIYNFNLDGDYPNVRTTLRNCTIYITLKDNFPHVQGTGVNSYWSGYVLIEDCRFIGQPDKVSPNALHTNLYVMNSSNPKLIFRNNYVFIPKEIYGPVSGGGGQPAVQVINAKLCENNVYETNLIPTATTPNGYFCTVYESPQWGSAAIVRNEIYNSGTAFRPSINSTWDTSIPYSQGLTSIGDRILLRQHDNFNQNQKITFASQPPPFPPSSEPYPNHNIWNKGDIIYNVNPIVGGYVGWVCTTVGYTSEITWQPSTQHYVGDDIVPQSANGYVYECIVAGKTGHLEPTWPTTPGGEVNDGAVVWQNKGTAPIFNPFGLIA